ncbi:putative nuclease HARBI1 [Pocillopora verrucosa]|uniref:putative nuclease HARBI1 n=1 Tax=Pocillopora verrucosa TaxID=203993 RepID=UPI0033412694
MSKHRLKNNRKLDLVKGRFKLCLTMFSWSAILKWRDLCATKRLRNYANRRNTHVRRVRHLRDRFNPLEEYDDEAFRLRFRLRKDSVSDLVKILAKDLEHQTRRGLLLTPMQQVLIALRFYATGTFQRVIGDLFGVSVFAACRVIHKVSRAIAKQKRQFLSIPGNLADVKRKFYDVGHFPGVIGAIDCTHVRVICPNKENATAFVNRKQFYSINVQAVCDSDAFITNIVARWPGSTHNSRIFENSNIAEKLRDGVLFGILLGDSGYACRAYLLTPILKPKNAGEVRYNTAHRRTRCDIERCFGLLKRRFPCLHLGLRTALPNILVIIVATAVLHNFALIHREQDFDEEIEDENVPFDIVAAADASGNAKRQLIISRYFA